VHATYTVVVDDLSDHGELAGGRSVVDEDNWYSQRTFLTAK
jgi:hypothetical protein